MDRVVAVAKNGESSEELALTTRIALGRSKHLKRVVGKMVVIINGEIVPDNDPRAIARRGSSTTTTTTTANRGPRVVSLGDSGSGTRGRNNSVTRGGPGAPQPAGPEDDVDGLLTPLSKILGIAGKRVDVPPVPQIKFTGYSFPLVHLLVSALVMLMFGNWRYFIAAFLALAVLNPK